MAIVFGEVEQCGLAGEESQIEPCLLYWRRMAAEDRIVLPTAAVKQLTRGDRVGCFGRGEQGDAGQEDFPVWLGSIGKGLCLRVQR